VRRALGRAGLVAACAGLLAFGAARAAFAQPAEAEHAAQAEHEAEQEHEPTLNLEKLAIQFLNFGVLAFALGFFGVKAVNRALLARHQQLKAELASAAEARAAAEIRLEKQNARLASLEQEIGALRESIKQEAEAEKARLIAAAEDRARRIREETAFMVEQQVKEAAVRLKRDAAEQAVRIAQELVTASLTGADQQRLLDTFVSEVGAGDGAGAPVGPHGDGSRVPRPAPRGQV